MTQQDKIRQHLQAGNNLTPLQAIDKFHCTRLAAVVHRLRKKGMPIVTEEIPHNGSWYARYSLSVGAQNE